MLSFEFSAFDLVLSVCVMVLIVLFVTTLLKLKPANENRHRQSRRDEVYEEEQESAPFQHEPGMPPVSWQNAEKTTPQKTQRMPQLVIGATAEGGAQESLEEISQSREIKEPHRQSKAANSAKHISKNSGDKDCLHHFGYLNGLPKNTPIPGECFGCPKIVDCLITAKAR